MDYIAILDPIAVARGMEYADCQARLDVDLNLEQGLRAGEGWGPKGKNSQVTFRRSAGKSHRCLPNTHSQKPKDDGIVILVPPKRGRWFLGLRLLGSSLGGSRSPKDGWCRRRMQSRTPSLMLENGSPCGCDRTLSLIKLYFNRDCYMTSKEQVHGMISQAEKVYTEIPRKCTGSSTDSY